ncbi:MAG: hypothetical protein WD557_04470 [Dehalococcoidia bacterium]
MDDKQTTPKGAEIPVPTRKDWEQALRKVAKPKDSPPGGPDKK